MITALIIKDFAIIDHLELELSRGFTVLTGETGAGKSIIMDALNLVLGGRASGDLIRAGASEAVVEAVFDIEGAVREEVAAQLAHRGIAWEEELIVRRVVQQGGRGRGWINGVLVPIQFLRTTLRALVDISGQHEHVSLLEAGRHILLLDRFVGHEAHKNAYVASYKALQVLLREMELLQTQAQTRLEKLAQLEHEIAELHALGPQVGERMALEEELRELSHVEQLRSVAYEAVEGLYEGEGAITVRLHQTEMQLRRHAAKSGTFGVVSDQLSMARTMLEEAVFELRRFASLETNPQRVDWIQNRLVLYDRLERRYLCEADRLCEKLAQLESQRGELLGHDERLQALREAVVEKEGEALELAKRLSQQRRQGAQILESQVEDALHALAMKGAQFVVHISSQDDPRCLQMNGVDDVEFLLSPNPGVAPRSLSRVASGGELSRVMLAIKQVMATSDDVCTYVFDEVDTGIGGVTAHCVASALKKVSESHQVLCITHLASIASYGDHHFAVEKSMAHTHMVCTIGKLEEEDRTREIARMLGGISVTHTTMEHAAEMLQRARLPDLRDGSS